MMTREPVLTTFSRDAVAERGLSTRSATASRLNANRFAVTLIELLVILGILGTLFGIGILFLSNVQYQQRSSQGAGMLQGWLNTARQKALLYRKPYGLRLLPGTSTAAYITDCQFIEQPEIFSGGNLVSALSGATPSQQFFVIYGVRSVVAFGGTSVVQAGDYLELEGGQSHRIIAVSLSNPGSFTLPNVPPSNSPPTGNYLMIQTATSLPFAIEQPISNYRIIRQPVPTADETLKLPEGVIIDTSVVNTYATSNPTTGGRLPTAGVSGTDILFAPSGMVLHTANNAEYFPLWVRDVGAATPTALEPTIVGVFVRTGVVAAHPVDPANYYAFLEDGRSSGLGK